MKIILFLLVLLFFAMAAQSQTIQQIDSLNSEICKTLQKIAFQDETTFQVALEKHIPEFYRLHNVNTATKSDSLLNLVYFRLQKNCNAFVVLLSKLEENKSDWAITDEKPKAAISDSELSKFFTIKNLYYKEYDGKIVNVGNKANLWSETFENGTVSKLEFKKTSKSTFVLKFIESNNETRKNFSVKGEEYSYGIYGKGENYYSAWVLSKEGKYHVFKLYVK